MSDEEKPIKALEVFNNLSIGILWIVALWVFMTDGNCCCL